MQPDLNHQINTIGVQLVGEVNSRTMREAVVAEDYRNAWAAGAVHAYAEVAKFIDSKRSVSGPYDDLRALEDMRVWLGDMIRAAHSTPMDG
jgi:hypothetical protein